MGEAVNDGDCFVDNYVRSGVGKSVIMQAPFALTMHTACTK